jgi:cellulose synthase/poly-beta-1,6-N-acetylglucosamine synthase-like glycosyltransferase
MDKTIFVYSPIHQREWILEYFLRNLYNLDYNKKLMHICWVINNCTDNSLQMLLEFKRQHSDEYKEIDIHIWNNSAVGNDERTIEQREKHTYNWLTELRNRGVKLAQESGCDFLFSVDSDILLTKTVLKSLVEKDKDYTSALIYNGYALFPETPWKYPNILKKVPEGYEHIKNFYVKNKTGMIEVDFTGAVFVCKKECLHALKFGYDKLGEDLPACQSMQKAGYKLYCSCDDYCQHVMLKELLDQYKNFGLD